MGHGVYVRLVTKYDSNAIILLLKIMFEVLNPFVQACAIEVVGYVVGFGDLLKKTIIYLVWVNIWKSPCMGLFLGNCLYSRGYL